MFFLEVLEAAVSYSIKLLRVGTTVSQFGAQTGPDGQCCWSESGCQRLEWGQRCGQPLL